MFLVRFTIIEFYIFFYIIYLMKFDLHYDVLSYDQNPSCFRIEKNK